MGCTTDQLWPDADKARLRLLWNSGELSTLAIAKLMRRSKNAVVGQAHRLKLAGKGSPIKRDGIKRSRRALRNVNAMPEDQTNAEVLRALAALLAYVPPAFSRTTRDCQWPIGELGRAGFRLCGDRAEARSVYCGVHRGQACGGVK